MRSDIAARTSVNWKRSIEIALYPLGETPTEVLLGTASGSVNIDGYCVGVVQTSLGADIDLEGVPNSISIAADQCVLILDGSTVVFAGVIESVRTRVRRGAKKTTSVTVRRRDASPFWRDTKRVSPVYLPGTDLSRIAREVCTNNAGLLSTEYSIPDTGILTQHTATQLADQSLWEMLTTLFLPSIQEPFIDARGFLKPISRDCRREPDYEIADSQIVDLRTTSNKSRVSRVRVNFVDPALAKVEQADRVLKNLNMTCGFFKRRTIERFTWSDDGTQRARDTYCVVRESINSGLMDIGAEAYRATSPYGGEMETVMNDNYTVAGIAFFLSAFAGAAAIPTPIVGGISQGAALAGLVWMFTRIGTGVYEIRGIPYDYVHAVNEVEVYDINELDFSEKIEVVESNLIPNESVAVGVATAELFYMNRSASKSVLTLRDNYQFEPGDLLYLTSLNRGFYVEDYQRNLMRAEDEGNVDLQGFLV